MRARSTLAALAAAAVLLALAPGASATIAYAPCDPIGFQCGSSPCHWIAPARCPAR
jgi:hypothetical protein